MTDQCSFCLHAATVRCDKYFFCSRDARELLGDAPARIYADLYGRAA